VNRTNRPIGEGAVFKGLFHNAWTISQHIVELFQVYPWDVEPISGLSSDARSISMLIIIPFSGYSKTTFQIKGTMNRTFNLMF
jgi:hypothetical protein